MSEQPTILYMGTPDFAARVLSTLLQANFHIIAVLSQPDKQVGRKKVMAPTPVKEVALAAGLPVLQPNKIGDAYQEIQDLHPDLILTCAYGQFVPERILQIPGLGSFNIHGSYLPRLRGGAPIHRAIWYGEKDSGISIIKMVKRMDAGEILFQEKVGIDPEETTGTLSEKLIQCACTLIVEKLPLILSGDYTCIKQIETQVTFARNIQKREEFIRFNTDYQTLYNHIRALIPSPGGYGIIKDTRLKLLGIAQSNEGTDAKDGTLLGLFPQGLGVAVKNRILYLTMVQPAGKTAMGAREFYAGHGKDLLGARFL